MRSMPMVTLAIHVVMKELDRVHKHAEACAEATRKGKVLVPRVESDMVKEVRSAEQTVAHSSFIVEAVPGTRGRFRVQSVASLEQIVECSATHCECGVPQVMGQPCRDQINAWTSNKLHVTKLYADTDLVATWDKQCKALVDFASDEYRVTRKDITRTVGEVYSLLVICRKRAGRPKANRRKIGRVEYEENRLNRALARDAERLASKVLSDAGARK